MSINQNIFNLVQKNRQLLNDNMHGIEREALRVDQQGKISQTSHPKGLGSALTHPYITTDYSEALLEFVTPTFNKIDDCLTFLRQIHQFTMENLQDDELMWMSSMPCLTPNNDFIPIAKYGTSNVAQMKEAYRRGLGLRYGRPMQTISGVHYNFSFSPKLMQMIADERGQTVSDVYLGLVRNFRRYAWTLIYFLGASPALCKSFLLDNQRSDLQSHLSSTLYLPYATSLRMSDLGYQNDAQSLLPISLNSITEYVESLKSATETPYKPYEKWGLKKDGRYQQLNTNILQIENEYYAPIRPKQPIQSGEKPSTAISRRGIAYVEVRCIDINPFSEIGIQKVQTKLTDLLLTYCLLKESPPITEDEFHAMQNNIANVAREGRDPEFKLQQANGSGIKITSALETLLDEMAPIAGVYDESVLKDNDTFISFNDALSYYKDTLQNSEQLPSQKIINQLKSNNLSYIEFAKLMSLKHRNTLKEAQPISDELRNELTQLATKSINEQHDIEQNDNISFDEYLEQYQNESIMV